VCCRATTARAWTQQGRQRPPEPRPAPPQRPSQHPRQPEPQPEPGPVHARRCWPGQACSSRPPRSSESECSRSARGLREASGVRRQASRGYRRVASVRPCGSWDAVALWQAVAEADAEAEAEAPTPGAPREKKVLRTTLARREPRATRATAHQHARRRPRPQVRLRGDSPEPSGGGGGGATVFGGAEVAPVQPAQDRTTTATAQEEEVQCLLARSLALSVCASVCLSV
jgi:hypothetical protein